MQTDSVLLMLLAAVAALAIVLFQYGYRAKGNKKLRLALSFLRFLAVFGLLALLVNPKFSRPVYTLKKTDLVLLADNSASITELDRAKMADDLGILKNQGPDFWERFQLREYVFATDLGEGEEPGLQEGATDISKALTGIHEIYAQAPTAVVLFTDGNHTLGEDYEYAARRLGFPIYPVVLGDTAHYEDLRIGQVNSNKYAFLDRGFPIEAFVVYDGDEEIRPEVKIFVDDQLVLTRQLLLSPSKNTVMVEAEIRPKTVGVKRIRVAVSPLAQEKNTGNNQRELAVEVVDEGVKVALISNILHPDIGALKKIIESNQQRSVSIYRSNVSLKELEAASLYVLYRPDASFAPILEQIASRKANSFIVGGVQTDWKALEKMGMDLLMEDGYPVQEVFAHLNPAFSKFDVSDFSFEGYPPLESDSGPVIFPPSYETFLGQRIMGQDMGSALLAVGEADNTARTAILLGQNIWTWRMHAHRETGSFEAFDALFGKLFRYLASNTAINRLSVEYEPIYNQGSGAFLKATYFDEAFVFDPKAALTITITDVALQKSQVLPLLLQGNYFQVDLGHLPAGNYDFSLKVEKTDISHTGQFTILDFDIEKQFTSSNVPKLERLAANSGGELYFPGQMEALVKSLSENTKYVPVQESKVKVVPLLDFKWILGIIVTALALEWFLRKYNGLI